MSEEKTNTFQQTVVTGHTLHDFIFAIDALRQEGWDFVDDSPPTTYGWMFECQMTRNPTQAQLDKDIAQAGKMSYAERLAKARAAKAAKAAGQETQESEEQILTQENVLHSDTQATGT